MRPHLMIVDDAVDQLQLMKVVFEMVDPEIEVITAEDGEEALRKLRQKSHELPRVILLDLRMPKKTGHEVLTELKADERLKRIPVCIFSTSSSDSDVHESYDRGASFYFKKPSNINELKKFAEHFRALCYEFASF